MQQGSLATASQRDADMMQWVYDVTGATNLKARRPEPAGRSRDIWILEGKSKDGSLFAALIRTEVGSGPWSDTSFTLTREGEILRALEKTEVPTPRVLALSDDGNSLLLEKLAGTAHFEFADDRARAATIDSYLRELVKLHALDVRTMTLPCPMPATPQENALLNASDYRDSYHALCERHEVIDEAFEWVYRNVPSTCIASSLVQGDAGPGNFMHLDGKITGLIDWEAAHIGDPMDDLAWLWFRKSFLRNDTDLAEWFERYAFHAGQPVDLDRVAYYRVFVLLRCAVSVLIRKAHTRNFDDTKTTRMLDLVRAALRDPYGSSGDPANLGPVLSGLIPKSMRE